MQVQDRVFVVTGGGNGIGREVVIRLLGEGGKVAAVDLRYRCLSDSWASTQSWPSSGATHEATSPDISEIDWAWGLLHG